MDTIEQRINHNELIREKRKKMTEERDASEVWNITDKYDRRCGRALVYSAFENKLFYINWQGDIFNTEVGFVQMLVDNEYKMTKQEDGNNNE